MAQGHRVREETTVQDETASAFSLGFGTRRQFLKSVLGLSAVVMLQACAPPTAPPAPPATTAPAAKPTEAAPAKPAAAAPTSAPAPAAKAAEPTEWIVALNEEPPSLDPNFGSTTSATGGLIHSHIYNGLYSYEANPDGSGYKQVPALAESYRLVDQTTWEFKLRKGVKFHNGDELTVEDVTYTFDDYMTERSLRSSLRNQVERVEVVDPATVRIITKGPHAELISTLSLLPIIPKKARSQVGAEAFNEKPIGTGAMKVVEWVKGQRLVLEANPNYWAGQVFPQRLVIRIVPDPTTRVAELKTGGVHLMVQPAVGQLNELRADPNVDLITLRQYGKGGRSMHYLINTINKPFDDVRVRQAANYAVNRDVILKNVLEGNGELLRGPFSSGWPGFDPNLPLYLYDLGKAKQLMAEAGYAGGVETELNTSSGVWLRDREISEIIAGQLGEIGIKARIVTKEAVKLLADRLAGTFEGITLSPFATSADPDSMINLHFYKMKFNAPDDQLNGLFEKTRSTMDPAERLKVLQDFGRYVHDKAYVLETHTQDEFWAKRKNVNWQVYPYGDRYAMLFRLSPRA